MLFDTIVKCGGELEVFDTCKRENPPPAASPNATTFVSRPLQRMMVAIYERRIGSRMVESHRMRRLWSWRRIDVIAFRVSRRKHVERLRWTNV